MPLRTCLVRHGRSAHSLIGDRLNLDGGGGVVLEKIFPDTATAEGDCKAGDIVLAIGGVKVSLRKNLERASEPGFEAVRAQTVTEGVMIEPKVRVFFYGSFINREVLAKG